jgi:hypothetical protein
MSEAYVCDRCDALGKGEPAARIVADGDGPGTVRRTTKQVDTARGGSLLDRAGSPGRQFGSDPSQTSVTTTNVEWVDLCPECASAFDNWWTHYDDDGEAVTDGGTIDSTDPRLGATRATEPYGDVLDAAHGRLDEDDPDMIFLVTARVDERSGYQRGSAAWTGATVGKRPAPMRPGDVTDQDLAEELIDHVLATLLLETDLEGPDLAERLAEIEAAMEFDSAGGEA